MRTVAEKLAGRAVVVQVNSEENQSLAARFAVRSIPVILLLRNGRVVEQLAGAQPAEAIVRWFNRISVSNH